MLKSEVIFGRLLREWKLNSGVTEINGEDYQYATRIVFPNIFTKDEQEILSLKGYQSSGCFLVRIFGKIIGVKRNIVLNINYVEEISSFNQKGRYSCKDWGNAAKLRNEQKIRLEAFNKSSEGSFQVLPKR